MTCAPTACTALCRLGHSQIGRDSLQSIGRHKGAALTSNRTGIHLQRLRGVWLAGAACTARAAHASGLLHVGQQVGLRCMAARARPAAVPASDSQPAMATPARVSTSLTPFCCARSRMWSSACKPWPHFRHMHVFSYVTHDQHVTHDMAQTMAPMAQGGLSENTDHCSVACTWRAHNTMGGCAVDCLHAWLLGEAWLNAELLAGHAPAALSH